VVDRQSRLRGREGEKPSKRSLRDIPRSPSGRALILSEPRGIVMPWESLRLPPEVDGSAGTFRAPAATCTLDASNDYDAIHAWRSLDKSPATRRTYRKEAERLILWATKRQPSDFSKLLHRPVESAGTIGHKRNPHMQLLYGFLLKRNNLKFENFLRSIGRHTLLTLDLVVNDQYLFWCY
jgi:hypothetical protein